MVSSGLVLPQNYGQDRDEREHFAVQARQPGVMKLHNRAVADQLQYVIEPLEGFEFEVIKFQVYHDDPTSRLVLIYLCDGTTEYNISGGTMATSASLYLYDAYTKGPITLRKGLYLKVTIAALAAGKTMTYYFLYRRYAI